MQPGWGACDRATTVAAGVTPVPTQTEAGEGPYTVFLRIA
jgi:hypothetical protein